MAVLPSDVSEDSDDNDEGLVDKLTNTDEERDTKDAIANTEDESRRDKPTTTDKKPTTCCHFPRLRYLPLTTSLQHIFFYRPSCCGLQLAVTTRKITFYFLPKKRCTGTVNGRLEQPYKISKWLWLSLWSIKQYSFHQFTRRS